MIQNEGLFQRPGGMSWFALAGSPPRMDSHAPQFSEHLLSHIDPSLPPVLITAREELESLALLKDVEVLLDLQGIVLPLSRAHSYDLATVSLLMLSGGVGQDWITALREQALSAVIAQKLAQPGLVLACDAAAAAMGEWWLDPVGAQMQPALGWFPGAAILAGIEDPAESGSVTAFMQQQQQAYAIGLGSNQLLALGPEGQVEIWSEQRPNVLLGPGWM